ncbi:ATP-dependent (S)-NAD(P)H-hydrate dehydratase [Armadillidium nasatum]|uniref:ATP-dependent (S)-NAD(P)H-hydrate dehydratase n=1 Tax=Armadillidium nasatum TaxID=96803 RepID=A0A5N5TP75_9CRUS|nr:ATP-dependent (S)-NAD(P)H-hydrate dehydratase [Armadillidium nasatum]
MSAVNGPTTTTVDSGQLTNFAASLIPPLSPSAHKGQAGRIGIVGGSLEYTGAPYFAASTTLRMGGDLAHVFCMREAALAIKTYSPDLIVHPVLDYGDPLSEIEEWLPRFHALVLGPGLGRRPQTFATLGHIIEAAKDRHIPMVLDADALFYLNENYDVIQGYPHTILTPNRVEMARLYRAVIKAEMRAEEVTPEHVQAVAQKLGVTILCKGANDVIASGDTLLVCDVTGSLRRCGGQGDILSGASGLFVYWAYASTKSKSFSLPPIAIAAWAASALTRKASSLAFAHKGRGTLTTDILNLVPQALASLFLKPK